MQSSVYTFFQSQSYWMQIHQGKVGSGQPNVNAKILSQIPLPLPLLSEQQAIVSEVESRLSPLLTKWRKPSRRN